ncbi:MAG TPA: hypothetical protein VHW47_03160, partial [Acidimicrobiales bacterium]|nr:hypothetical protein [Acidimicrobiales bacterium]
TSSGVGVTVSWEPTTAPIQAVPGETTHGTFWVSNETPKVVPISILPGTAVPGNNGNLGIKPGADPRFPTVSFSPASFIAQPDTTTPVSVTITTPPALAPGVYLVPAVVQPTPPKQTGNIHIQQEIDALVTFQVPGDTTASVRPTFVQSTTASGSSDVFHFPGLPEVQLGTAGHTTLRVLNDSPSSFYAYNEVTGTQTPFGKVIFEGHIKGQENDVRTTAILYFPSKYRDFPMTWSPSSLGFGVAHINAFVSYHPKPSVIAQKETSTEVLVVSPWWVLILAGYLLLLLLWARRGTRRQVSAHAEGRTHKAPGLAGQVAASVVMIAVVVAAGFLSLPVVLAVVGGAGVVVAVVGLAVTRRLDRHVAARRVLQYEWVIAVLLLAGVVATILAGLSKWSGGAAMGVLAGAGVWIVLTWWALWWNAGRSGTPSIGAQTAEPPPGAEEPVPVGS